MTNKLKANSDVPLSPIYFFYFLFPTFFPCWRALSFGEGIYGDKIPCLSQGPCTPKRKRENGDRIRKQQTSPSQASCFMLSSSSSSFPFLRDQSQPPSLPLESSFFCLFLPLSPPPLCEKGKEGMTRIQPSFQIAIHLERRFLNLCRILYFRLPLLP